MECLCIVADLGADRNLNCLRVVQEFISEELVFPLPLVAQAFGARRESLLLTRIVESWFGFVAERRPRVATVG